jgi:hypothetical protein
MKLVGSMLLATMILTGCPEDPKPQLGYGQKVQMRSDAFPDDHAFYGCDGFGKVVNYYVRVTTVDYLVEFNCKDNATRLVWCKFEDLIPILCTPGDNRC